MRILVVCQYYHPEPFRITDICEELKNRGHDITVVTGTPNYPMGKIYKGYEKGKRRDEIINGVKVHRCYTIPRKTGVIRRFLNYYSYAISSSQYIDKINGNFDVVFVNQLSPIMMANAAIKYKKKNHAPIVMYCLDLWPESLIAGGISRKSIIYKYFHHISKNVYRKMDRILVTSKMFKKYFKKEFNIKDVQYVPQYAEEIFKPCVCHKKPDEKIELMFAGNIGVAQSVQTIIYSAEKCKNIENLYWHIVGDGSDLEKCKNLAKSLKLKNVIFHGRKKIDEMPEYYRKADAMLVTMQIDEVLSLTLPGKVQSYMAAGKPIIGAIDGETEDVIKCSSCGYVSRAEDVDALAENVRKFVSLKQNKINEFGNNSRRYYEKNFQRKTFMDDLEETLQKFCL